ncbi:hypothetical protein [Leptobacterium sp. I13]|uniref:hypothetical protein n=1 Tax=Leptobacterium meishanense TaxID=3128904 RepID=UPI0030EC82F0
MIAIIQNINRDEFDLLSLIISVIGLVTVVFFVKGQFKYPFLINLWLVPQMLTIYVRSGKYELPNKIYDTTQAISLRFELGLTYGDKAYIFGVNFIAIILYFLWHIFVKSRKDNNPN